MKYRVIAKRVLQWGKKCLNLDLLCGYECLYLWKVWVNVLAWWQIKAVNCWDVCCACWGSRCVFKSKVYCDVVCSPAVSHARQKGLLGGKDCFLCLWSTQISGINKLAARGKCWPSIVHSQSSVLDLMDWLWWRKCWFSLYDPLSTQPSGLDGLTVGQLPAFLQDLGTPLRCTVW